MSELVSNQASGFAKVDSGTALSRVLEILADVQSESLRGREHYPLYANKYKVIRFDLEDIAAQLPCWTIVSPDGSEYLRRYTIGRMADGSNVYLHCFQSSDKDQELHCHPWPGTSFILAGCYSEERRVTKDGVHSVERRDYRPGDVSVLRCDTFHRVDLFDHEGRAHLETWTLFITGPKQAEPNDGSGDAWGFWSRVTNEYIPWRTFMKIHGIDPKGTSDSLTNENEKSAKWWRDKFATAQEDILEASIALSTVAGSMTSALPALADEVVAEVKALRVRVLALEAEIRRNRSV